MNLRRLAADAILAEYGRVAPGEHGSVSRGEAIGVAFTPQHRAVFSVGSRELDGPIEPSSVFIVPKEGIDWISWDLTSETIEMWLDRDLLSRLSHQHGGPSRIDFDLHDRVSDSVIVDIASRVRRALCSPAQSKEVLAHLGHELALHYLRRYAGVRIKPAMRPLDDRRLKRVFDLIDAHLREAIVIDRLADVAAVSPFHFARTFKAATGSSPHAFIVARRMDRAAALLRSTNLSVAEVAKAAGFASLPHFRAHFRRQWGADPGAFSRAGSN